MALLAVVMVGGAAGAVIRYLIGRALNGDHPWGTLVVNLGGAWLLGTLLGLGPHLGRLAFAFLGTGLCGALTTWSTLATELVALPRRRAVGYGAVTLAGGLAAVTLGWETAVLLVGDR